MPRRTDRPEPERTRKQARAAATRARAEAESKARADARRAELDAERRIQAALTRRKPRAAAVVGPAVSALAEQFRGLMRLADVPRDTETRALRLLEVVERHIPTLATIDALPLVQLVAGEPWVRELGHWRPHGPVRQRRDGLVVHLLTRFPVPRFLCRGLDLPSARVARVPREDAWPLRLLAWLGQGRSLHEAVRTGVLPVPLTHRMQHLFVTAADAATPIEALRSAQLVGNGGTTRLLDAVLASRLGTLRLHRLYGEAFWAPVLAWLARTPDVVPEDVPELVEFVEDQARTAPAGSAPFSLTGRTGASVRRLLAPWRLSRQLGADLFPASGYRPLELDGFGLVELRHPRELVAEGSAMSHCVGQYGPLLRAGRVAIWSVRHEGRPVATVEVATPIATVVQARGFANGTCPPAARTAILAWAALNDVRIAA